MPSRRSPAGQRTSARILEGARELFNISATSSVTTNHIAAHVGISPGNLYYWYPDKRAIIRALWAQFAAARSSVWEAGDTLPGPEALVQRWTRHADVANHYAFLSRELAALAHADPELRASAVLDRNRRTAMLAALLRSWRADGLLRPVDDERLADLVQTVLLVSEAWPGVDGVAGAADVAGTGGARLLRALLEPHLV